MCFSGERCTEWQDYGWLRRDGLVYSIEHNASEQNRLHAKLLSCLMSHESKNVDLAKCLCEQMICNLNTEESHTSSISPHASKIDQLLKSWRTDPTSDIDLKATAKSMNMSYTNFRRIFRLHSGQTPYQCLSALRIAHACSLLLGTSLSVKEISVLSGFKHTESFNRLFKQRTGHSPTGYRDCNQMSTMSYRNKPNASYI